MGVGVGVGMGMGVGGIADMKHLMIMTLFIHRGSKCLHHDMQGLKCQSCIKVSTIC